jgi:hypothetical protein
MGGQDRDLMIRALNYDRRFALIHIPQTVLSIENHKRDSLCNTDMPEADWKSLSNDANGMTRCVLKRGLVVAKAGENIGGPYTEVPLSRDLVGA